jgi:NifU-like protein involved in Fe-S cluster formation
MRSVRNFVIYTDYQKRSQGFVRQCATFAASPLLEEISSSLIMTYSATFKDHLSHPRNAGELLDATVVVEELNPVCGDRLRLSLKINANRIESVRYLAYGCPPTLVSGSVLTELIDGKTIDEARSLTREELIEAIGGLPNRKHHAAALAIEALTQALTKAVSTS